jgi:hypothetical protein
MSYPYIAKLDRAGDIILLVLVSSSRNRFLNDCLQPGILHPV